MCVYLYIFNWIKYKTTFMDIKCAKEIKLLLLYNAEAALPKARPQPRPLWCRSVSRVTTLFTCQDVAAVSFRYKNPSKCLTARNDRSTYEQSGRRNPLNEEQRLQWIYSGPCSLKHRLTLVGSANVWRLTG